MAIGEKMGLKKPAFVPPAPNAFTGVRVFSATMARDRDALGDMVTTWLRDHPRVVVTDKVVSQSSDNQFHCLAITIFYQEV